MPSPEALLAKARKPARDALRLHPFYHGKVQVVPKCAIRDLSDFAVWYTPGVAAPCRAIAADPEQVFEHTNRGNTVAVVSNGSRVLGLGDIGPQAALPVMEGKALLFKYLGGVDAVPLCIAAADPDALVQIVRALEPSFGGINLEDIAQPDCFRVLDGCRDGMQIPVWHDDQQGTAVVVLAGLRNALRVTGRELSDTRIAMVGMGAANVAVWRLLVAAGASPEAIVACDRRGVLHSGRQDVEAAQERFPERWRVCTTTNGDRITGGIADALRGADVCLAFSSPGPDVVRPEWIRGMADAPIVFACANPVPEIWPWVATEAGARIVATGRSDFPNQVNNSLGFPGIFRGALDVRADSISDGMALAAAEALATVAEQRGLSEERIVPPMDDAEAAVRVAVATGMAAQAEGLARVEHSAAELETLAVSAIRTAREATRLLQREGLIALPPDDPESIVASDP